MIHAAFWCVMLYLVFALLPSLAALVWAFHVTRLEKKAKLIAAK